MNSPMPALFELDRVQRANWKLLNGSPFGTGGRSVGSTVTWMILPLI